MPKITNSRDPEEIGQEPITLQQEKPLSQADIVVMDEMRKLREEMVSQQQEIIRLRSIADENKGRAYDHEKRDKSYKGYLRFVDDINDPIIWWKSVSNVSYVDPTSGNLIQDQKMEVKTLKGKHLPVVDIHTWNMWKANQTKFRFIKIDHQNGKCDVQLSTDMGQSYVGEVVKDLDITFVNP